MKQKTIVSEYWREYPERDPEYVRWYPPQLGTITGDEIWEPRPGDDSSRQIAFYLHVPLCYQLCKYCPFNKLPWTIERAEQFVNALKKEIALAGQLPYLHASEVVAGYLGGGTPTTLSVAQLSDVTACLHQYLNISPNAEMSIEANPDTVDVEKLKEILHMGYNRISFGVQSFNDELLSRIGRTHRANAARQAIQWALEAGFENVGIDLIYGLPGQTLALWEQDLREAVALGLHQVTTFCLYVPPGTALYSETRAGKVGDYPDEQQSWAMYSLAKEILTGAGHEQYTAYDFALPGKASVHHAINWRAPQGEYLGFGPGAFSHIHGHIFANTSTMDAYMAALCDENRLPVSVGSVINRQEEMARFMVLGLKYLSVDKAAFSDQFGITLDGYFGPQLTQLEDWGLIEQDTKRVWITPKGETYLGNICKTFYTQEQMGKPQPRVK
jgi:oxygen-independent coproporphyrinogen-3 oxidase